MMLMEPKKHFDMLAFYFHLVTDYKVRASIQSGLEALCRFKKTR